MSGQTVIATTIAPADHAALKNAVKYLEGRNFAARLADYAGVPVNRVLGVLPKAINRQLSGLVRNAVMKGLAVAVDTLDDKPPRSPAMGFSSFLAGVTGGVPRGGGPRQRGRVAVWSGGFRQGRRRRAADSRRGGRRHRQYRLHGPFP